MRDLDHRAVRRDLSDELTWRNVRHRRSDIRVIDSSRNLVATDGSAFFAKISRTSTAEEDRRMRSELSFAARLGSDIARVRPLVDDIVRIPHGLTTVTIWHHARMETLRAEQVDDRTARTMAAHLRSMHALDVDAPPSDLTVRRENIARRLGAVDSDDAHVLRDLADAFVRDEWLNAPADTVVHGDAHLGNFAIIDGSPSWFDFESVMRSAPEWDAATVSLALDDNPAAWRAFVSEFGAYDEAMFERCRIVKMISATSLTATFPDRRDKLERQVARLRPLLAMREPHLT